MIPDFPAVEITSTRPNIPSAGDMERFRARIERVKAVHRVEDVIGREAGVVFKRVGSNLVCRCPFPDHEDKNPSFTVSPRKQYYKCFGCGRDGDVLKFLQEFRGLGFREALDHLDPGEAQAAPAPSIETAPAQSSQVEQLEPVRRQRILTRCREFFHRRLQESQAARAFLLERGLWSWELASHFKLGFDDGSINQAITPDMVGDMTELGLLNGNGNSRFYQCLTVGLCDDEGNVVGLYGRRVNPDKGSKHQFPRGRLQGLFNAGAFKASREIILTEGVIDALSYWIMGLRNVSCIFSAAAIPAELIDQIVRYGIEKVYLGFDNDSAGERACELLARALAGKGVDLRRIAYPQGIKDVNELLVRYGRDRALEICREALDNAREFTPRDKPASAPAPGLKWDRNTGSVQGKLLGYRIEMLAQERGTMRVLLTAMRGDVNYTDKLDLYRSQARHNYAQVAARRFSLPLDPVERELDALLELLRKLPAPAKKSSEKKGPPHTPEQEQQALAMLRDPEFFAKIPKHCDMLGYVGESQAKQILYLCASSRKQETPLPGIVRALSSGGKTALMEVIASMMPPEDVLFLSEISRQSLFYMTTERIRHKLILVDESSGSEEASYAIRTLLSRGVLRKAVPVKDAGGDMQTVIRETRGPIGFLESTTSLYINQENENRCLLVYLDDSAEQTRRIHEWQKMLFTPEGRKIIEQAEHIRKLHQVAQRLLKPCKIDIPFVHHLEFPSHWPRTRRDHFKFLLLLGNIAFLHQYQRKTYRENDRLVVVADLEDYEYAYNLAQMILRPAVSDLSDKHQELLEGIDDYVAAQAESLKVDRQDVIFTRGELCRHLNWQLHQVRNFLPLLVDLEYLTNVGVSIKGVTHRYRRNYNLPDPQNPISWLLTPDQLRAKLHKSGATGNSEGHG